MLKKLYWAMVIYGILGLGAGLFFREYTKAHDFTGYSELAVTHTHILVLGFMVMLILLGLEKVFELSKTKSFSLFFWHYNGGLVLSVAMMFVIGMRDIAGLDSSAMFAGIAGLGHIIITVGLVFLFVAIGKRLETSKS